MGRYRCHLNLKSYQDFDSWCGEHSHRVTERRCTVAMIVLAARDYPDVDELHSRVRAANPRISLATLDRTLRLLVESGLIERHTFRWPTQTPHGVSEQRVRNHGPGPARGRERR